MILNSDMSISRYNKKKRKRKDVRIITKLEEKKRQGEIQMLV